MKLVTVFYIILICQNIHAQLKLGSYRVQKEAVTISGFNSGGAMATQMHTAFSKTFSGVGIVSAAPYYCAGTAGTTATLTTCTVLSGLTISIDNSVSKLSSYVSRGLADDTINMKNDKVYLYHGTMDYAVTEGVVKRNEDFYKNYLSDSQIKKVYNYASSHGFITNNFGAGCNVLSPPNYINNCNYNQAYDMLKHLYSLTTPEPSKNTLFTEKLIEFDQTEFFPSGSTTSLDSTGYLYVPRSCSTGGKACKLHVYLHGCQQGKYNIGTTFIDNSGFNQVADANDIIILYPQAKSTSVTNANGCWDWWGYINQEYANKSGPQMQVVKAMIDRIAPEESISCKRKSKKHKKQKKINKN